MEPGSRKERSCTRMCAGFHCPATPPTNQGYLPSTWLPALHMTNQTRMSASLGGAMNGIGTGEHGLRRAYQSHLCLILSHFYSLLIYPIIAKSSFNQGSVVSLKGEMFVDSKAQWSGILSFCPLSSWSRSEQTSSINSETHLLLIEIISLFYFSSQFMQSYMVQHRSPEKIIQWAPCVHQNSFHYRWQNTISNEIYAKKGIYCFT